MVWVKIYEAWENGLIAVIPRSCIDHAGIFGYHEE